MKLMEKEGPGQSGQKPAELSWGRGLEEGLAPGVIFFGKQILDGN